MVRTQIQLTDAQAEAVKKRAAELGVSIAELIRRAVEHELARDSRDAAWERAMSVVGKFHDREGRTDVSERHDDYLAEALEQDLREGR